MMRSVLVGTTLYLVVSTVINYNLGDAVIIH